MLQRHCHLAALIVLLVASVSGCATVSQPESNAASPVASVPALTEAAANALKQAEADIKMAQSRFALWTTAEKAYKEALEAAKAGDNAKVIKAAATVSSQVNGGLAQLNYPSTEM